MKVKLATVDPFAPALELCLDQFPVVIGRNGLADVAVDDRWTSEQHCKLKHANGVLTIRDLSSRHGTLLNGQSVEEATLQPGDILTIGIRTFRVSYREPSAKAKKTTIHKRSANTTRAIAS